MMLTFTASARIHCEMQKEYKMPQLRSTEIILDTHAPLEQSAYENEDGLPNAAGLNAMRSCFIQGLVAIIHTEHQQGIKDSAENIRFIIDEIARGFAENVEVTQGIFNEEI